MPADLFVGVVVRLVGQDEVGVPAFLHLAVQLADVDVVVGRLAEHLREVPCGQDGLVHLVADDEQVALPAPLLPGVGDGVPGDEIGCQFIGFALLPAAVALQEDRPELVVHPVVRLELADLQRHPIGLRRRRCRRT